MTEDKSISLVNLGPLSKPADTLIKKISSAVGGIFEPWQIKRVVKAEAEASLIKAKAEIEVTDLHRRAMHLFRLSRNWTFRPLDLMVSQLPLNA